MITEKTLIELSEPELKDVLCKHFGLKPAQTTVNIYKYDGDQRDPSYVKVSITGVKETT